MLLSGRVQGVWYRGWMKQEATRLGLSGWVRNLSDGRVEALISGIEEDVDEMSGLCWQGPPLAKVTDIALETTPAPAEQGFRTVR